MIYVIDRDGWVLRYLDIVSLGISFIGLVVEVFGLLWVLDMLFFFELFLNYL